MMSSYDDEPREGVAPSAARVGADLRAARERIGWTLPAIAGHLRIRLPFLQAIEDGRIDLLPGNAYAIGFLRTYAQAVGLDADEVARRFRAEAAETNRKTELNFPAPVPERGIPAGAIVLVGALIAIGAYVGWYKMSGARHPTAAMIQPLPDRLAPLADKGAPLLVAPSASPLSGAPPAAKQTIDFDPPAPVAMIAPGSAAAASPAAPAFAAAPSFSTAPTPAPATSAPLSSGGMSPAGASAAPLATPPEPPTAPATELAAAGAPVAPPAPSDGPRIVLRAKADAWIQVREKAGSVLLNRVLRSGETWPVPVKGTLLMTTGNAGGTELDVDGQPTASLGADGAVRRDLPLDADAIKDGKLGLPGAQTGSTPPVSAMTATFSPGASSATVKRP